MEEAVFVSGNNQLTVLSLPHKIFVNHWSSTNAFTKSKYRNTEKCLFGAQETFLIIINVENICAAIFFLLWYVFFKDFYSL